MVIRPRIEIPDHFSSYFTIAEWGILRDLLAYIMQSPAEMTDANNGMHPLHFWSDPADIWIRIKLEMRL